MWSSWSPRPLGLFLQGCFQEGQTPLRVFAWGCSSLVEEFVELHKGPVSPFLQPFNVPLNGRVTFWGISHSYQLHIICEFAKGALCPITQVFNERKKHCWPQYWPLGFTAIDIPWDELNAVNDTLLEPGSSGSFQSTSLSHLSSSYFHGAPLLSPHPPSQSSHCWWDQPLIKLLTSPDHPSIFQVSGKGS